MTADYFDETIKTLIERVPFKMFLVELNTGEHVQIDHSSAMMLGMEERSSLIRVVNFTSSTMKA